MTIDDNALFRHPDLEALADAFPIDPVEKRAKDADLQYVKLDGEVGIIGNGAGLVMSTLDVVAQAGAQAANFLDVGGGASAEKMATSLQVILSDPAVRCVFINIFGGITRCDVVANGILEALGAGGGDRADRGAARTGRTPRRVGAILAEAAHPRIVAGRHDGRRRRRGRPAGAGCRMSVLVGADTKLLVQGITGQRRHLPHAPEPRVRDRRRRRRHARQGRAGRRGHPRVRHRRRRRARPPARTRR